MEMEFHTDDNMQRQILVIAGDTALCKSQLHGYILVRTVLMDRIKPDIFLDKPTGFRMVMLAGDRPEFSYEPNAPSDPFMQRWTLSGITFRPMKIIRELRAQSVHGDVAPTVMNVFRPVARDYAIQWVQRALSEGRVSHFFGMGD